MKEKENKLIVGQTVFVRPIGNASRWHTGDVLTHIKEAKIEKIGRKYFYLEGYRSEKFGIEEMRDISDYSSDFEIYISMQDIKDKIEATKLNWDIKQYFNSHGNSNLSLKQLRKIKEVIDS